MSILAENILPGQNIADFAVILTYVNNTGRDLAVLSKVEVGSLAKPIAGGGNYELKLLVNNVELLPNSLVRAGSQAYVGFQSRHLSLQQNQTLSVQLKGQPGDTDVRVESVVNDVTPVLVSDLAGAGTVPVDHDYGGTDELRVVEPGGAGVQDVSITAYLAADYNAGNRTVNYVKGRTTTSVSGRWRSPLALDPGSYVLVFARPAGYQTAVRSLAVGA